MATILTKKSDTASAVPLAADLTNAAGGAELAVNATDKRLFSKTSGGSVVELGTNPSSLTMPNGTANGVAYLNGSKVVTSGSALTFDGTNLGIGASSPLKPLDITFAGTSGARRFLVSYDDSVITIKGANASNDPEAIRITGDNIRFNTGTSGSGSEQMRLTSTGLGIGTSSPAYKLDVQSGTATIQIRSSTTSSGAIPKLRFEHAGNDSFSIVGGSYMAWLSSDSTERMRLDSSGNLGLGVTPSASWLSTTRAFQLGAYTAVYNNSSLGSSEIVYNTVNTASDSYVYANTGFASSRLQQRDGAFRFFNAPSGTAGNAITFTQAMTLDASGNLLLGATDNNGGVRIQSRGIIASSTSQYTWSTFDGYTDGNLYITANAGEANTTNSNIIFRSSTSGNSVTERARIDSSGNLLLNTTSSRTGVNSISIEPSGNNYIEFRKSGSGSSTQIQFNRNTDTTPTSAGSISTTGTTASYNTSSDYRLKQDIAPITNALDKVTALKPVTFKWNTDGSDGEGFIAHELAEVCPQAVNGVKDAVDEEGNPIYQGIDTSFLVATLTAAIQELKAEFDAYKASHP